MKELPELLLIDKPVGITSFDVIRQLRRRFPKGEAPKMGHAGTLDPLASGLMLIGVGSGTKKLAELVQLDKTYEAEILLGEQRTTGDMEGEVVASKAVREMIPPKRLEDELERMVGTLRLPVSAYSAIKKDGVPMYKRARKAESRGEQVSESELPQRDMQVHVADLVTTEYDDNHQRQYVQVRFEVGSGTYIRSLAEEYGRRLGYPATLAALRRTRVGEFRVEEAEKLA